MRLLKHSCIAIAVSVIALLMAIMTSAPVCGQAATESATVDVVLHKLVFDHGKLPSATPNNGHTSPFTSGAPLNGVTFTAYDVTYDFWAENPQSSAAMMRVQAKIAKATYVTRHELRAVTTAGQGTATFANLPLHAHGHYAVYLFRETHAPAGVNGGQNLVLVLPATHGATRIDLYPKNETTVTPITTGGQRFVKVDAKHDTHKLAGAKFVVRNQQGQYLTTGRKWRSVTGTITTRYRRANLLVLTSDDQGQFAIDGLATGKYAIVEVHAPAGYLRSNKAVPFTIVPGKTSANVPVLRVVNLHAPPPTGPDTDGYPPLPDTGFFGKIEHHWHHFVRHVLPDTFGSLPQTGAARAMWATMLGLGLLLITALGHYLMKRRQHEGE
jgi:LPXTG-motif cell wall-anchored protein